MTETFEQRSLEDIRSDLTDMFGGVTVHANAPAEGLWSDDGHIERDCIAVVEVMTEELNRPWWADYRKKLEMKLSQDEIVVRATWIDRL